MREILASLGGIIGIASAVPYLIDMVRNKTHPNIVTWFTWALLNAINMWAAWSVGSWQTALYSGGGAVATGAIVVVGLKHGVKKYTTFDIVCQVLALLGIPLWLLTGRPELAVMILIGIDFAGGLPTLRHAWIAPHEETWLTFAAGIISGLCTLASLSQFGFVSLAMPVYITLYDVWVVAAIFYRRKILAKVAL